MWDGREIMASVTIKYTLVLSENEAVWLKTILLKALNNSNYIGAGIDSIEKRQSLEKIGDLLPHDQSP